MEILCCMSPLRGQFKPTRYLGHLEFDLYPQETFEVREILSVFQQMYQCSLTI